MGEAAEGGSYPAELVEQERAYFRFCERQGLEPVATFVERADGGREDEYYSLLRYLAQPERGFISLVVSDLEHLAPSLPEALRRLVELDQMGVPVHFVAGGEGSALDQALRVWCEREERGASARVRQAMEARAMRGQALGRPAYGYRVGPDRRFQIEPEEAKVVQRVFRLYLEDDLGVRLIARRLNEEGIRTRRGGRWSVVGIRDMLLNRTYTGTYSRFGIRVPGNHPAIIDATTLQRAQEKLASRRSSRAGKPRGSPFLLSGLVYCGHCGNKMIGVSRRQSWTRRDGSRTRGEYRYYQCQSRTNQSVCQYHTRRAEELEAEVIAQIGESLKGSRLSSPPGGGGDTASAERARLEGRLRNLDRQLRQELVRAIQGVPAEEGLSSVAAPLVKQYREAEARLRELEEEAGRDRHQAALRAEILAAAMQLSGRSEEMGEDEKRRALELVLDHVVVYDDSVETHVRL